MSEQKIDSFIKLMNNDIKVKNVGTCVKCGKITVVRKHHWHGYSGEHIDDVVDYCYSCDRKAHNKARKIGKCTLSSNETSKLSMMSSQKRNKEQHKGNQYYNTIEEKNKIVKYIRMNLYGTI